MLKIMVILKDRIGNQYFPVRQEDDRADAERDIDEMKALNPGFRFAIMEEDECDTEPDAVKCNGNTPNAGNVGRKRQPKVGTVPETTPEAVPEQKYECVHQD